MDFNNTVRAFKMLGHPARLNIVKALIPAGKKGLPVGDLQKKLNIPNSTLSHHVSSLVSANLLIQNRDGRILYCIVNYEKIDCLKIFLEKDCCIEELD